MFHIRKSEIPVAVLLLPYIIGVAIGFYFNTDKCLYWVTAVLASASLIFLLLNIFHDRLKVYRQSWLGGLCLHVLLLLAGWLCLGTHLQIREANHFSKTKADFLVLKVTAEPRQNKQFFRFAGDVESSISKNKLQPVTGKLLVTIVADSNSRPVNYGDVLLIPANYKLADPPFNPAEFNYKQYLAHQNIYHQCFITKQQFVKTATGQGNAVIAYALRLRHQMVQKFKAGMHNAEAAAVASTLILGYKADLSPDVVQAYSKTGTIHVLSVSGAHVAVIFALIAFFFKPFKHNRYGKWISAVLSLLLIWSYALLTGFSPAVCRAALMISLLIISEASNRQAHRFNSLAVSAFILLLYNPLLITDVGFQLSYLAVAGLIVFQPVIADLLEFKNRYVQKLWYICSVSLAAQIITFPLSAYYFHQFPVYFLISNLFIILPSDIILSVGMLYLLLDAVPIIGTALAFVLEHTILIMNKYLAAIEHWPYASIGKIWLTPAEHIAVYVLIALLLYFMVYKKVWQLITGLLCMLLLVTSVSFKTYRQSIGNTIMFLNTKKHTALVLRSGNRAVAITDLKQTDKTFQYSIQPALDSMQADNVNVIGLRQNLHTSFMHKERNFIQFRHNSILVFDPHLQTVKLPEKLHADYLFITGSPQIELDWICKNYTFGTLILDANNSVQCTQKLLEQAKKRRINIFCLRRNNALVIASK